MFTVTKYVTVIMLLCGLQKVSSLVKLPATLPCLCVGRSARPRMPVRSAGVEPGFQGRRGIEVRLHVSVRIPPSL